MKYKFTLGSLALSIIPVTSLVSCSGSIKNPEQTSEAEKSIKEEKNYKKLKAISASAIGNKPNIFESIKRAFDMSQNAGGGSIPLNAEIGSSLSKFTTTGHVSLQLVNENNSNDYVSFDYVQDDPRIRNLDSTDHESFPFTDAEMETEFQNEIFSKLECNSIKYTLTKNNDNFRNVFYVADFDFDFTNQFESWMQQISPVIQKSEETFLNWVIQLENNGDFSIRVSDGTFEWFNPSYANTLWEKLYETNSIDSNTGKILLPKQELDALRLSILKAFYEHEWKTSSSVLTRLLTTQHVSQLRSLLVEDVKNWWISNASNVLEQAVIELEKGEADFTKVIIRDKEESLKLFEAKINEAFSKWLTDKW